MIGPLHAVPLPQAMSALRVLVTGATGFLGSHLVTRLRDNVAELHATSRRTQTTDDDDTTTWWRGDLSDERTVQRIMREVRPDLVVHLASHGSGTPDRRLVVPTLRDDLLTTINVLQAASDVDCGRVVFASSLEEDNAAGIPASPYAAAKQASSMYQRMFHELYDLPVVSTRVFMTYGPGQRPHKLIPYVVDSLANGESPKLSSGTRPVDWIYVDDVIDGFVAAATAPDIEGSTLDLGSGRLVPVREVVETVAELVGGEGEPLFGALPDRPLEQVRVADVDATAATIEWRPQVTLEDGLRRTVEALRSSIDEPGA